MTIIPLHEGWSVREGEEEIVFLPAARFDLDAISLLIRALEKTYDCGYEAGFDEGLEVGRHQGYVDGKADDAAERLMSA